MHICLADIECLGGNKSLASKLLKGRKEAAKRSSNREKLWLRMSHRIADVYTEEKEKPKAQALFLIRLNKNCCWDCTPFLFLLASPLPPFRKAFVWICLSVCCLLQAQSLFCLCSASYSYSDVCVWTMAFLFMCFGNSVKWSAFIFVNWFQNGIFNWDLFYVAFSLFNWIILRLEEF